MNTQEINKILQRCHMTSAQYVGCVPSDRIPRLSMPLPHCMVVNVDSSSMPGSHWVAIYVQSLHEVEYFDSLGDWPPRSRHIRRFMRRFSSVRRCIQPMQSDRSSACGKHVIYFLCHRCQGWTMHRILRHLKRCNTRPDRVVSAFSRKFIFNAWE